MKRSSVLGCQQLKSNGEAPVVVGEPVPRERSRVAFGVGQREAGEVSLSRGESAAGK